jgi:branched-chain amino acid transport system permease protein
MAPRAGLRLWLPDVLTAVGLAAAPFALPLIGFAPDTMNRVLVFGLFGIGFDLLFGYTGLLSFGQSAFFGTGGFVAAYLLTVGGLTSVLVGLLIGIVAAAAAGLVVGLIALRRTGIYFAMITVAIAQVFFFVENSPLSAWTGGENGLPGVPAPTFNLGFATIAIHSGWTMYGFLAVCYLIGMMLARRMVLSPVGRILVAIRDNPLRARALGHAVHRYKLLAFVIAAAYAGFAGGLLGVLQGYMPPEAFTFDTSGQLVMQTVIGGLGTLYGPLVGAAVWLYLRDMLQSIGVVHLALFDRLGWSGLADIDFGVIWKLVLGLIFVLLVCFLRRGVIGGLRDLAGLFVGPPDAPAPAPVAAPALSQPTAAQHLARRPAVDGVPALQVRGLTKRYGGLTANKNIDFAVAAGELRAVIGPNGAGKSTFFKMLTCEVKPSAGQILFNGDDITGLDVTDVCQRGLTKSYQVNQLFTKLTVRENLTIAALAEERGRFRVDLLRSLSHLPGVLEQVDETLAVVGLMARAGVPVAQLAYGEKRRLEIGLALATSPSLLLLDEPLAGMSPQERLETVQLLKLIRLGRTLVIVEHDMDAIFELAERITVLHEGAVLAEGTPEEIQANSFVQEAYLGGVVEA